MHTTPLSFTAELHHVIPVAWQLAWQPLEPWPDVGVDPEGRRLWDARTIAAAPTCHRNVHVWIVAMMSMLQEGATRPEAIECVGTTSIEQRLKASDTAEWAVAAQALGRFAGAGGDLGGLIAAGELGRT